MSISTDPRSNQITQIISLIGAIFILGISIWIFGHKQLGGFDHSALIDTGWRLYINQKPYQDFVVTTPPGFYLGAMLALKIWGVQWSAFVMITILFAEATFITQVFLLRRLVPWHYNILMALTCQLLTTAITAYWWYNAITSLSVCLFLSSAFLLVKLPQEWQSRLGFCLAFALLIMMKPNLVGVVIVLVLITLFIQKEYRVISILLSIAGLFLAILFLLSLAINPLDVLKSYLDLSTSRGLPSVGRFLADRREEAFVSIPLIFLCICCTMPVINQVIMMRKNLLGTKDSIFLGLAIAGIGSGILGFLTNQDSSLVDMSIIFISGTTLTMIWIAEKKIEDKSTLLLILVTILCEWTLLLGFRIHLFVLQQGFHVFSTSLPAFLCLIIYGLSFLLILILIGLYIFIPLISKNPMPFLVTPYRFKGLYHLPITALLGLVMITISMSAIYIGAERWRVRYIGPFYDNTTLVKITSPTFFKDFSISPQAANVIQQIQTVVQDTQQNNVHSDNDVFFGPRLVFGYAAFEIPSPKGLPIWWHTNNSFPQKDTQKYIDKFLSYQFKMCIFLVDPATHVIDTTFIPAQILQDLEHSYQRIDYPNIVVFKRIAP